MSTIDFEEWLDHKHPNHGLDLSKDTIGYLDQDMRIMEDLWKTYEAEKFKSPSFNFLTGKICKRQNRDTIYLKDGSRIDVFEKFVIVQRGPKTIGTVERPIPKTYNIFDSNCTAFVGDINKVPVSMRKEVKKLNVGEAVTKKFGDDIITVFRET